MKHRNIPLQRRFPKETNLKRMFTMWEFEMAAKNLSHLKLPALLVIAGVHRDPLVRELYRRLKTNLQSRARRRRPSQPVTA
jgi:hypothetical protein